MLYNVKLSSDSTKKLCKLIGLNDGNIILSLGVIQVTERSVCDKIASMFKIDSINGEPYRELTKEERKQIIGNNLEVGSVVRIQVKNYVEHVVVIAVDGNKYTVAKLVLDKREPQTNGFIMIQLKKGFDILYRNMNYRYIVTLVGDVTSGLEKNQFLRTVDGIIVGKVTNLQRIQPIIDLAHKKDNKEEFHTE